jgi:RHH-type proline utilization regulon transcriptional repressor/proline dehydrogenase/delta 1-pyrroline-5-carboxylate dehydrogenase
LLCVLSAESFEEAIAVANATPYGLTGGVFSRSPAHLEYARRELRVGNLYLNRATTGAIVGRQPFGGLKSSGAGWKAGGPDYVRQFLESRAIAENTLRHGFAPEI